MAQKFKPLSLDLIDEGKFLEQVQADLRHLQQKMVAYATDHGDLAEKAKGKLTIEISFTCDAPKDRMFSVRAITKTTIPNSPPSFNAAMGADDDDGNPTLFVRASGGTASPPQQSVLSTQDGRKVNTETGEILP